MLNAYGVWVEKSMYGRNFMGIERATFLVGTDGKIEQIWRKVKVKGHVDAVLKRHVVEQNSLAVACRNVLTTENPREKAAIARRVAEDWRHGRLSRDNTKPTDWPDRPARRPSLNYCHHAICRAAR